MSSATTLMLLILLPPTLSMIIIILVNDKVECSTLVQRVITHSRNRIFEIMSSNVCLNGMMKITAVVVMTIICNGMSFLVQRVEKNFVVFNCLVSNNSISKRKRRRRQTRRARRMTSFLVVIQRLIDYDDNNTH